MGLRLWFCVVALTMSACTEGHCRRKVDSPAMAVQPVGPQAKASGEERTFVYKYDGGLQCGAGKVIALDVMAKELRGITVFSQSKKRDGLMHIQVCGSITGMANVFEIPTVDLKKAENLGFKKWSFE